MTWKSTLLLSGAGLIATWFVSPVPGSHSTSTVGTPVSRPAQTADPSVDIVHQADRLRARLHPTTAYSEPARDPFRFGVRPKPAAPVAPARPAEMPVTPLADVPPAPTLRIALSGIAEDTSGGKVVRTAIISMPDDVVLVKEGDTIAGQYRVTSITSDAVELTRQADNFVVRLGLRP